MLAITPPVGHPITILGLNVKFAVNWVTLPSFATIGIILCTKPHKPVSPLRPFLTNFFHLLSLLNLTPLLLLIQLHQPKLLPTRVRHGIWILVQLTI